MTDRNGERLCVDHCQDTGRWIHLWRTLGLPQPLINSVSDSPASVVYYLRFGDRIKIGTSTNLQQRMTVIPHDELLGVEPGSFDLERERHHQFADYTVPGQREWFYHCPALAEHIATLT